MFKKVLFSMVVASFAGSVFAGANCPKQPKDQWMNAFDMQKKIVNEYGFAIKKFKVDGQCYEIYGWDYSASKDKPVKVEVYFNPVTGAIVKKEID